MGMSMIHSRRFPQSGSVFGDASKLKIKGHIYIHVLKELFFFHRFKHAQIIVLK